MKANRKTMLGVALAVAVIALAGIGYAAFSGYTAETYSNDNTATTKYITVKLVEQDDNADCITPATGVYTGQTVKIEYNTVTTNDTNITYTMKEASLVMSFKLNVVGVNTGTDTFKMTVNLPNPTIPGAGAVVWKWNEDVIAVNEVMEGLEIDDMNDGVLSMTIPRGASPATTAPSEDPIEIGDITITIEQEEPPASP